MAASEGPFAVDADTLALYLLNGSSISTAGVDETGVYDATVEETAGSGVRTYDATGYADSAGLDATDKGVYTAYGYYTNRHCIRTPTLTGDTALNTAPLSIVAICNRSASGGTTNRYSLGTFTGATEGWHFDFYPTWFGVAFVDISGVYHYRRYTLSGTWKYSTGLDPWLFFGVVINPSRPYGLEIFLGRLTGATIDSTLFNSSWGSTSAGAVIGLPASPQLWIGGIPYNNAATGSYGTFSTVQIWGSDIGDAGMASLFADVKDWVAAGGLGRRDAILHGVGRGLGRGMR